MLARIFQLFQQVDAQDARAEGGFGIGLAVVRDLVTLHGGTVDIEQAPGGGARFLAWFRAEPRPHPATTGGRAAENGAVPV